MSTTQQTLTVAIYGASGFLGKHITQQILETTNYRVVFVSRHPDVHQYDPKYSSRITAVAADIFDQPAVEDSLQNVDVAVYLIHMMGVKGDYYKREEQAARSFGRAAKAQGIDRVVYMSGLGNDRDRLSRHLASRHHTGKILKQYVPIVLELRASMIVGEGSVAYDSMRRFVHDLPVQFIPSWAVTMTQPITADDAAQYVLQALTVPIAESTIIDIGGPEQFTYKELIAHYAAFARKNTRIIVVPFVPIWLGAQFLNWFAPKHHAKVGQQMAESLKYPMVIVNEEAAKLFPGIQPEPIERAFT